MTNRTRPAKRPAPLRPHIDDESGTINLDALRTLAADRRYAPPRLTAKSDASGNWLLRADARTLISQRGDVRAFRTADALLGYVREHLLPLYGGATLELLMAIAPEHRNRPRRPR